MCDFAPSLPVRQPTTFFGYKTAKSPSWLLQTPEQVCLMFPNMMDTPHPSIKNSSQKPPRQNRRNILHAQLQVNRIRCRSSRDELQNESTWPSSMWDTAIERRGEWNYHPFGDRTYFQPNHLEFSFNIFTTNGTVWTKMSIAVARKLMRPLRGSCKWGQHPPSLPLFLRKLNKRKSSITRGHVGESTGGVLDKFWL